MLAALQAAKNKRAANPKTKVTDLVRENSVEELEKVLESLDSKTRLDILGDKNPEGNNLIHISAEAKSYECMEVLFATYAKEHNEDMLKMLLNAQNKRSIEAFQMLLSSSPPEDKLPVFDRLVNKVFELCSIDFNTEYINNYLSALVAANNVTRMKQLVPKIALHKMSPLLAKATTDEMRALLRQHLLANIRSIPESIVPQLIAEEKDESIVDALFNAFKHNREIKGAIHELFAFAAGIDNHYSYNATAAPFLFNYMLTKLKLNINSQDTNGKTILHHLIETSNEYRSPLTEERLEKLLQVGAKVDLFDNGGLSPVHYLVIMGRMNWLEYIWKKFPQLDASIEDPDKSKRKILPTLYDCAAVCTAYHETFSRLELFKFITAHGGRIPAYSPCVTILCTNRMEGKINDAELQYLLQQGGNPNIEFYKSQEEKKYSIPFISRMHESPLEFYPSSSLGGAAYFIDTKSKSGPTPQIKSLLAHKAKLAAREMDYFLGIKNNFKVSTELAIAQAKDTQIAVREKQHLKFDQPTIEKILSHADAQTYNNFFSTCTWLRSTHDTDKQWSDLVERDYPGEKYRTNSEKYLKYRYAHLHRSKCTKAQTLGFKPTTRNQENSGLYSSGGENPKFELTITPAKNGATTFQYKITTGGGMDGSDTRFSGEVIYDKKYMVLKSPRYKSASWSHGGGGEHTENEENILVAYYLADGSLFMDTRLAPKMYVLNSLVKLLRF